VPETLAIVTDRLAVQTCTDVELSNRGEVKIIRGICRNVLEICGRGNSEPVVWVGRTCIPDLWTGDLILAPSPSSDR